MATQDLHRVHCRLDELLEERQMTLTELSDRVGITIVNLSILKNDRAKAIRFSTLTAIVRRSAASRAISSQSKTEPTFSSPPSTVGPRSICGPVQKRKLDVEVGGEIVASTFDITGTWSDGEDMSLSVDYTD
jgi:putative transcriptional regulator